MELYSQRPGQTVRINATNPRTNQKTSYLEMQIPIEDIDKVIQALIDVKTDV